VTNHCFYAFRCINWEKLDIKMLPLKQNEQLVSKTLPDPANPRKVKDLLFFADMHCRLIFER